MQSAVAADTDSRASAPIALEPDTKNASTNHPDAKFTNDTNIDRTPWSIEIQYASDDTNHFDKTHFKATYWYLSEQIAERLKSDEFRNATIYKFNPDVVSNQARFAFIAPAPRPP
ncbi:MAG: hypothetical protein Q8M16_02275 [Pirellulaceae bacterium]|nr:hypothetical protein [Pirellulaceae bacterium]